MPESPAQTPTLSYAAEQRLVGSGVVFWPCLLLLVAAVLEQIGIVLIQVDQELTGGLRTGSIPFAYRIIQGLQKIGQLGAVPGAILALWRFRAARWALPAGLVAAFAANLVVDLWLEPPWRDMAAILIIRTASLALKSIYVLAMTWIILGPHATVPQGRLLPRHRWMLVRFGALFAGALGASEGAAGLLYFAEMRSLGRADAAQLAMCGLGVIAGAAMYRRTPAARLVAILGLAAFVGVEIAQTIHYLMWRLPEATGLLRAAQLLLAGSTAAFWQGSLILVIMVLLMPQVRSLYVRSEPRGESI
jgi:hypothetical protein